MLQARDIMTADVTTVRADLSLGDLESAFIAQGISGFPVLEGQRLVGLVSRSDVVRKLTVEASISGQLSDYQREIEGERASERASARAEAAETGIRMGGATVADVMCRSVVSVGADDPVQEVARLMVDRRVHRVPVLDGERLAGIITSLDLVRVVAEAGHLEPGATDGSTKRSS